MDKDLSIEEIERLVEATDPEDLDTVLSELELLTRRTPSDYQPHPKQLQFHTSDKKIRLLCGGNRSGKTEAGTLEAVFHATGLYPDWYPTAKRILGPNRGRVVVTDYAKGCGESLQPKIDKWFPPELIVEKRRTQKGFYEKLSIKHVSGGISTIDIMTHEQDDDQFEGWSGHWAWFDEPPPREKWVATMRGLIDLKGRCWLTLTPMNEPWMYDEFITKQNPDVFFINVDQTENPYITKEEQEAFLRILTEDEKEARLHGNFRHLSGLIYKEFNPAIHLLAQGSIKIDKRWPVYFVLDPADRRPHHAIWARVDPFGTIYIIDELVFKGSIKDTSKVILMKELSLDINPNDVIRILDPNKGETANAMSEVQGITLKEEFARHAVYFTTKVNDKIDLGHLLVSERLYYNKTIPLSSTNHPKLFFIKETTKECIKQLQTYVWDDWRGAGKDSKSQKEKPKDINKDMPDCIRYLVVYNPQFYIPGASEADPEPHKANSRTGYH